MIKRLLIILIAVFSVTAGAVYAAPTPKTGTLPFYWITGTAVDTTNSNAVMPNRAVAFYKEFGAKTVTTLTDLNGNYRINVYELNYYYGVPITFETEPYNIAVCRDASSNLGTVESINLTISQGYTVEALGAVEGGGPYIGEQVPAGTVPLKIERVNNDIKISWDPDNPAYATPEIFILTGDGSGVFTNSAASWTPLATYAADHSGEIDDPAGLADSAVLHLNQVGNLPASTTEAYYKAVEAGIDTTALPGTATLESAWAVGKVNIDLKKATDAASDPGMNYISIPLAQTTNSINNLLPVDQFDAGSRVFSQIQTERYNFDIAKVVGGQWVSAFAEGTPVGGTFMIVPEKGYMINVPNDKTITVWGNVLRGTEGRTKEIDPDNMTYFGNFYAAQFQLFDPVVNSRLKLIDTAAPNEGDRIYYQLKPGTLYNFNIAEFHNGAWKSAFDTTQTADTDITLKPPFGYMYERKGSGFIWTR